MSLDSTMSFEISGPGGGGNKPNSSEDRLNSAPDVASAPSPNDGDGGRGANRVPSVSKPESKDIISSVFYDPCTGNPGTLDTTLNDVLEISFGK